MLWILLSIIALCSVYSCCCGCALIVEAWRNLYRWEQVFGTWTTDSEVVYVSYAKGNVNYYSARTDDTNAVLISNIATTAKTGMSFSYYYDNSETIDYRFYFAWTDSSNHAYVEVKPYVTSTSEPIYKIYFVSGGTTEQAYTAPETTKPSTSGWQTIRLLVDESTIHINGHRGVSEVVLYQMSAGKFGFGTGSSCNETAKFGVNYLSNVTSAGARSTLNTFFLSTFWEPPDSESVDPFTTIYDNNTHAPIAFPCYCLPSCHRACYPASLPSTVEVTTGAFLTTSTATCSSAIIADINSQTLVLDRDYDNTGICPDHISMKCRYKLFIGTYTSCYDPVRDITFDVDVTVYITIKGAGAGITAGQSGYGQSCYDQDNNTGGFDFKSSIVEMHIVCELSNGTDMSNTITTDYVGSSDRTPELACDSQALTLRWNGASWPQCYTPSFSGVVYLFYPDVVVVDATI